MTDDPKTAWNANACFWDERMGEGNEFFNVLLWPTIEKLLDPTRQENERARAAPRILDVACGNGVTSRRLTEAGWRVTGFDFAEKMIDAARTNPSAATSDIEYRVLDATDESALRALGEGSFEAAISNMALMDMAEIDPLMRAVRQLLIPGGVFVFSVMHPAFNGPGKALEWAPEVDGADPKSSIRVTHYLSWGAEPGVAIEGQPELHPYYNRPLNELLGPAFRAGFTLDALEEPTFPPDYQESHPPARREAADGPFWPQYSEIPPVLIVRLRAPAK